MFLRDSTIRNLIGVFAGAAIAAGAATTAYAQTPGVTKDQILVGGAYPISGPVRFITKAYEHGANTVFNQVNAAGGIHGRKIKWLAEDDGYQAARTLSSVKKLIDRDGIFLIFGLIGQAGTNTVAPFADSMKIPTLAITSSTEPSKYLLGLLAPYSDHAYILTKQLITGLGAKRIGYLYQNDDLGAFGRIGLDRALKELGVELAAAVGFERGTQDLTTSVLKLRDANVDTVVNFGPGPLVGVSIKQAATVGYKPRWATYSAGIQTSVTELLGDQINGLVFDSEFEIPVTSTPVIAKIMTEVLKDHPDAKPDPNMILGYAQAKLLVHVLTQAGPDLTREKVLEALNTLKGFDPGVMPMSYSETKRFAADGIKVYQWRDGKPVALTDWLSLK